MGAKTWMLVHSTGNPGEILKGEPVLDRDATTALVRKVFAVENPEVLDDGDLYDTCPDEDEIIAASFSGLTILAAVEFGIDYPSQLPSKFIEAFGDGTLYLHAMHSAVDWFAYAVWKDGKLQRALSLAPDGGILEDIGDRLSFEEPYWRGEHPAVDPDDEDDIDYPFVFHPLELGEAALLAFFGYQLEGVIDSSQVEPESISLMRFKRN